MSNIVITKDIVERDLIAIAQCVKILRRKIAAGEYEIYSLDSIDESSVKKIIDHDV